MNYTTNYNLNKPEGTDLYNHLTIDNPNMDTIDAAMYANKLQAIGNATELVSGTVHAITRGSNDQNIFKFKATGNFSAGDTITVDGVSVNAYTTAGQQLPDDAYILSAEVICVLDGTSLWILTNKTPDASDVPYDANDTVKDKIDNIMSELTLQNYEQISTNLSDNRPIYVRKYGKIVEMLYFTDLAISSTQQIAQLPNKYIPDVAGYPWAYFIDSSGAQISVGNTGDVNIYPCPSGWKTFHALWLTYRS
ncbi:MAG: hypothetical protein J6S85_26585 [Methanobrevibacter sp.]|nr:hypothetical protein [Methanobrevibacter sp.]MBO7717162.1 hypothetical protein [Methanobrevibacter sp.]